MCQMNVVFDHDGEEETIMNNVTLLEVTDDGVLVSTLFEEPKLVKSARVKNIDFLNGKITLNSRTSKDG